MLHGIYPEEKYEEIDTCQTMEVIYDQNEVEEKNDPLPSFEKDGVSRRKKCPFKNERKLSFWNNILENFVEKGGTILSFYVGSRLTQFIMREKNWILACVVENIHVALGWFLQDRLIASQHEE